MPLGSSAKGIPAPLKLELRTDGYETQNEYNERDSVGDVDLVFSDCEYGSLLLAPLQKSRGRELPVQEGKWHRKLKQGKHRGKTVALLPNSKRKTG
jgi:hypothetical protein